VSLQPNLLLSFLASVFSTVVLLSVLLSPRLISDFFCSSQLLPFFSLYSLLMARLWRFGFLFCSSVSSLSRASVLRRHRHPLRCSCVVVLLIGVPFLCGLSFPDHRFSSVPSFFVLCFMFHVL
jgi:hypothetical protein